jgi:type IV pilus assembly protein PilB
VRHRIGECLLKTGLITQDDLQTALAEQERTGERLGIVMTRLNRATERQIAETLAAQLGFSFVDLAEHPPDPKVVSVIPRELAQTHACVAVSLDGSVLRLAMADPLIFSLVQELEAETGYHIKQVVAAPGDIRRVIQEGYPEMVAPPSNPRSAGSSNKRTKAISIERLLDGLVETATGRGVSEVHIEPLETRLLIRRRTDGFMKDAFEVPKSDHERLVTRLKTLAGLDTGERRLPQDGRVRLHAGMDRDIDFRISTLRTLHGEKIVLRAFDQKKNIPDLQDIGMSPAALRQLRSSIEQRGLVLFAGPIGSGKTTTVSAVLKSLPPHSVPIISIEDPIEYVIPDVSQVQVDETSGLTYSVALRSIRNQAPAVVFIGELRDSETAALAVQAAEANQLVLSTLVADDAVSCLMRFREMGLQPSTVASVLVGVVAQRLVRRLCRSCRQANTQSGDILPARNTSEPEGAIAGYTPAGCGECDHTGYRGRVGIFEMLPATDTLKRLILAQASEDTIRETARRGGMVSLAEDGWSKVMSGMTSAEELLRVAPRPPDMRTLCHVCGSAIGSDFAACAVCGARLGRSCSYCGRALQPDWQFCPFCARSADLAP